MAQQLRQVAGAGHRAQHPQYRRRAGPERRFAARARGEIIKDGCPQLRARIGSPGGSRDPRSSWRPAFWCHLTAREPRSCQLSDRCVMQPGLVRSPRLSRRCLARPAASAAPVWTSAIGPAWCPQQEAPDPATPGHALSPCPQPAGPSPLRIPGRHWDNNQRGQAFEPGLKFSSRLSRNALG